MIQSKEFGATSRRRALKCMAWAGAGVAWTIVGGVPRSVLLGSAEAAELPAGSVHFVQISDTHVGFAKEANPDALGTTREAIAKIKAMTVRPDFVVHTGDVSHLSKAAEYDLAQQLFSELSGTPFHVIPGEHDMLDETPGALFHERFGQGTKGAGWYSFDQNGVHFVALVNVFELGTGGQGSLGREQLEWLEDDLKGRRASTPIVVFAHIPLWSVYPDWGWGTSDSAQALAYLKRFGSVTVLNGHIHQVIQKVEGNISFHTAMSTAYPQPHPGDAPSPGPLKVPTDQLRTLLGVRQVNLITGKKSLAIVEQTLASV